jgi:hypothetical protein
LSGISPESWSRLSVASVRGDALLARRATTTHCDRLLIAVDAEQRRHLLVRLNDTEGSLEDNRTRGLRVTTIELRGERNEGGRYLDVVCRQADGHAAFDLLANGIADGLNAQVDPAPTVVSHVLSRWRIFWGSVPLEILSLEQQLGLFGELWFMQTWLARKMSWGEAIRRWRAPLGARHDFEWQGRSVEVKATTSTRGLVHRINGVDQLDVPEVGELLLFSLRVREEAGATNSLQALVQRCQAAVNCDPDSASTLDSRLARAGYSPAHAAEYERRRLRVVEESLYRVGPGFPRIVRAAFASGVPAGVEHIGYEINLSGFEAFKLAASPDAPF